MEELQTRLIEEQRRTQHLEETLRHHVQQSSSQINMKQVNYFFIQFNFCNKLQDSLASTSRFTGVMSEFFVFRISMRRR